MEAVFSRRAEIRQNEYAGAWGFVESDKQIREGTEPPKTDPKQIAEENASCHSEGANATVGISRYDPGYSLHCRLWNCPQCTVDNSPSLFLRFRREIATSPLRAAPRNDTVCCPIK